MGALIITPLLGFVINVMRSDRQEQAKSSSEQEIQTALDYIGRDLAQAIFIYDGFGLEEIKDQLPQATGSAPVLVFWKREFIKDGLPKDGGEKDDAFVMSLVAYYQIKDANCNNTSSWSCTTRISRVQLRDGLPELDDSGSPRKNADGTTIYRADQPPSPGFKPFPAGGSEVSMNQWTSDPGGINDAANSPLRNVLIDYVDQTPFAAAGLAEPFCPETGRALPRPDVLPADATNFDPATPYTSRTVPNYNGTGFPDSLKTGSFYACVNTDKTIAQVFIRGNSKARIEPKNDPPTYSEGQTAYFPKASIQVQGRGLITENTTN